jgi:hypothetical protein
LSSFHVADTQYDFVPLVTHVVMLIAPGSLPPL